MKKIPLLVFTASALTLAISAQKRDPQQHSIYSAVANGTVRTTAVIVGSAAKVGWETTKFTARHAAGPAMRAIVVKAAPRVAAYTLRTGARYGIRYGLPLAAKLSIL